MTEPTQSAYLSFKASANITLRRIALRCWPKWLRLGRADRMYSLADHLYARFEQRGAISDLGEAIALQRNGLEFRPEGHPDRAASLANLANSLYFRFEELETLSDLEESLAFERSALELRLEGHPERATSQANIASSLYSRFQRLGVLSDLEEALALERNVLELHREGHPDRATSLASLATSLHARFEQLGTLTDLDEAIVLQRNVLELRPQGYPNRATSLCNLALYLYSRFEQLGMLSDLDEALALERNVLELCPQGHPGQATSLGNLAASLHSRFKQLGTLSDLDEAIILQRNVLELYPQGHPNRATSLAHLGISLHSRFRQLGVLSDLDEALALERNVLELRPEGHPQRAASLGNLASSLNSRFKQLGTLSDLDEALALQRNVLELRPEGDPDRATALNNLALHLLVRFKQLGTLSDLDQALALQRNTLELCPEGHPGRAIRLGNLAVSLHYRFDHLGTLSDLDEALALERMALELRPEGHLDRATLLANLATSLCSRFEKLGTLSDLDEALSLEQNALELRPEGHPHRATSLGNLALYLHARFKKLGTLSDLDQALTLERHALEILPEGHFDRATSLANLAASLHTRFKQLGKLSDLEEALALERNALELRPEGHPHRAASLGDLATYHYARFKHSTIRDISDLQETFDLYSQLSDLSHAVSLADVQSCKSWIQLAEECKHNTTVLAYQTFLRLTTHHLTALPSLPRHLVLLKQLMTSMAADAFSACVRYDKHADAVELLEQGRGVFWSQLFRLRSPLDEVMASGSAGKNLTDRFTQLSSLLRTVLNADAEAQHDRACRLSNQLQDIVNEIRTLPGQSRFLLPPLFSELRIAASGGPVIIVNASQYSCDALIVLSDRDPIYVALPVTKSRVSELSLELRTLTLRAKFSDLTREFMMFLRKLWDDVVSPIVEIIQEFCHRGSRIWWCPTVEFSLLPLHAAASFRKGQPMLSELYISSYTPTLAALIRARQKRPLNPSIERHRFLVVGQAQAPGQCELASVNTELSSISQRIGSVATFTCVQDQNATIATVAEEFQKNEFIHLACHGIPDQKQPFESGFALGDGLMKVEKIMQYDLQNAQFAYLSACHTTVGDEESPDEVIHLAAAMQFAGFRSVIGTMWAVDDGHTNEITSKFYEYMLDECGRLDHARAGLALHRTMISLRSSKIPLDQRILYIHIGA